MADNGDQREWPLAYHITWTTYGTWLPGDQRGWVEAVRASNRRTRNGKRPRKTC